MSLISDKCGIHGRVEILFLKYFILLSIICQPYIIVTAVCAKQ